MTKDECHIEVMEAWRIAGLRTTTFEDFMQMIRALGYVLFRCPEECRVSVEAAIVNAERRAMYAPTRQAAEGAG